MAAELEREQAVVEVVHIDDNSYDLDLTEMALADCCPQVRYLGITDPRAGVLHLVSRADRGDRLPTLVLLDLNMPCMRGTEVLSSLRRHPVLRNLPVVVLTTSSQPSEADACRSLGARSVVRKPERYDDLVQTVHRLVCAHES